MILIGLIIGTIAGAIVLLFSHWAPRLGAGNFIRDIDRPRFLGKEITRREAHLLGLMVHLCSSAAFGGLYGLLIEDQWIDRISLSSILGWGVIMTIFIGGVVLPLEGHGMFGVKEDAWFPVDLILTNVLWAVVYWWLSTMWMGNLFFV